MGTGDQAVLALPWHLYLDFPWTQGRTVVNPMASYFQRPVISGDNIEAGDIETESTDPRSEYLTYLFSVGSDTTHLGRLLAPLGIRYVLLAKTDDWKDYSFLDTQADIRVVKNWGDLTLFENMEPAPLATAPTTSITVDTWGDVVGLAQETSLADYYVVVRNPGPGPIREPALGAVASPGAAPAAKVNSPVQVTLRNASAAPYLVVSEPYDPDWSANGQHASEELGALTGFTECASGNRQHDVWALAGRPRLLCCERRGTPHPLWADRNPIVSTQAQRLRSVVARGVQHACASALRTCSAYRHTADVRGQS